MKKSVQLYAIRALAERDFEAAIRTVAEIGYEGIEFAGFFGHSAEQVAEWLNKYNLVASGAHVDIKLITEQPDETIAFHRTIGNSNIICPWASMETRAEVEETAARFRAVAPKYKAAGMKLGYHNHSHEFAKDGGECLIDILAANTSPDELMLEFDAYWVYRGGADPVKYMEKYADRVNLFHAKDGNGEVGTVLGKGEVDLKSVFAFAKAHNFSWAVVESEASEEELQQIQSIKDDYNELLEFMK